MSDSTVSLRRKIENAGDLQSVVRAMKNMAASEIGQYEKSLLALEDYEHAVMLGLGVCLERREAQNQRDPKIKKRKKNARPQVGCIIFGSDQGMVGGFNTAIVAFAEEKLKSHGDVTQRWTVGTRAEECLNDLGKKSAEVFPVPSSAASITPLVDHLLFITEKSMNDGDVDEVYLIFHRPVEGSTFESTEFKLLPLDIEKIKSVQWPDKMIPDVLADPEVALRSLIAEYLFVSVFRAAAMSLASENASRLAAMQRADKNIKDSLVDLNRKFHRERQSEIDEELFDVISSFEALNKKANP